MKELQAFMEAMLHPDDYQFMFTNGEETDTYPETLNLELSGGTGIHIHTVTLDATKIAKLENGNHITMNSKEADGHRHQVKLKAVLDGNGDITSVTLRKCDGVLLECPDGHNHIRIKFTGRDAMKTKPETLTLRLSTSTDDTGTHTHTVTIDATKIDKLKTGSRITVNTDQVNGHHHQIKINAVVDGNGDITIVTLLKCDDMLGECPDGHDNIYIKCL